MGGGGSGGQRVIGDRSEMPRKETEQKCHKGTGQRGIQGAKVTTRVGKSQERSNQRGHMSGSGQKRSSRCAVLLGNRRLSEEG